MKIFYADDDPEEISLFRETLKTIDPAIECIAVSNGADALRLLAEITPDLIFLDEHMPRLNGTECLKVIRQQNSLKGIPVVMYSNSNDASLINVCARLGATGFLDKTTDIADLRKQLRSILSACGFQTKTPACDCKESNE
jgi:CheY-like chemotaxis protein